MIGHLPQSHRVVTADRDHLSALSKWLDTINSSCMEASDSLKFILQNLLLFLIIWVLLLLFIFTKLLRWHIEQR